MNLSVSFRVGLLPTLVFSFLQPTLAGIRPSFSLDYSSWHATEIVLVEVTPTPGVFRVTESLKGGLEVGNSVAVSELQPATGAMDIATYPKEFAEILRGGRNGQIPAQQVGSRMILFLKKAGEAPKVQWQPADVFGAMKTSVVWIDGGQLYRFQQVINPGPSVLVSWDIGLGKMKDRIEEIRRIQLELAKVIAIEDDAARAEGLKVYVRSDVREAQQLALSELGKCGPKALTTIREMLSDPAFADKRAELVKAFADAGDGERKLAKQIESALRAEEPDWKYVGYNESRNPAAPCERHFFITAWKGPQSQNVQVWLYMPESLEGAMACLQPYRDKQLADGWQVSALQIGDEGYLATYKSGETFSIAFRKGTVAATIKGHDFGEIKDFAQCIVGEIPAN
jgi:hypothetical protein